MKKIYLAIQSFRYERLLSSFVVMDIVITWFLMAAALGTISHVYQLSIYAKESGLVEFTYIENDLIEDHEVVLEVPTRYHAAYQGVVDPDVSFITFVDDQLFDEIKVPLDQGEYPSVKSGEELPVLISVAMAKEYEVGESYHIYLDGNDKALKVKITGILSEVNDKLEDAGYFGSNFQQNFSSMVACYSDDVFLNYHLVKSSQENTHFVRIDDKIRASMKENPQSFPNISVEWTEELLRNHHTMMILMLAVLLCMVSMCGISGCKALKALAKQKQDIVCRLCGATGKQLLWISMIEDTLLFLLSVPMLLLLLKGKDAILTQIALFSDGFLEAHPVWNLIQDFFSPISTVMVFMALFLMYLMYMLLSMGIGYSISNQNIKQGINKE